MDVPARKVVGVEKPLLPTAEGPEYTRKIGARGRLSRGASSGQEAQDYGSAEPKGELPSARGAGY